MKGNPRRKMRTRSSRLVILCIVLAVVLVILLCLALYMDSIEKLQNVDPVTQNTAFVGSLPEQLQDDGNTVSQTYGTDAAGSVTGQAQGDEVPVSVTQQGEIMVVTTVYGQLSYPSAFIDVIQVRATDYNDRTSLEFEGNINGSIVPLFFLWFNGESGQPVGTVMDAEGQAVPVSVEFFPLPEGLTDSEKETFFAAQETVNDVLTSLEDNENYIGK